MRIGYCTRMDPFDRKSRSGLAYSMMKALERRCGELLPLGPLSTKRLFAARVLCRLVRTVTGRRIDPEHAPFVSRSFGRAMARRIGGRDLDLLFFPNSSEVLAYLEGTKLPVVYSSDATFKNLVNYYAYLSNLMGISERWGNEIERRAIEKADLLIYPSRWSAESAVRDYGASPGKIHLVPCGGNVEAKNVPGRDEILSWRKEEAPVLELLFIGGDWKRKGGDIALESMEELNRRGIDARLTVCGGAPHSLAGNEKVEHVGFLDPNSEEDMKRFRGLYRKASFFILPTRSEAFGFVFAEASAYGLPVIGTDTGGVPDYVDHGGGGYLLPLDAGFEDYADRLEELWRDKERYRRFSAMSREKYERELNWDTWAARVGDILSTVI